MQVDVAALSKAKVAVETAKNQIFYICGNIRRGIAEALRSNDSGKMKKCATKLENITCDIEKHTYTLLDLDSKLMRLEVIVRQLEE